MDPTFIFSWLCMRTIYSDITIYIYILIPNWWHFVLLIFFLFSFLQVNAPDLCFIPSDSDVFFRSSTRVVFECSFQL